MAEVISLIDKLIREGRTQALRKIGITEKMIQKWYERQVKLDNHGQNNQPGTV